MAPAVMSVVSPALHGHHQQDADRNQSNDTHSVSGMAGASAGPSRAAATRTTSFFCVTGARTRLAALSLLRLVRHSATSGAIRLVFHIDSTHSAAAPLARFAVTPVVCADCAPNAGLCCPVAGHLHFAFCLTFSIRSSSAKVCLIYSTVRAVAAAIICSPSAPEAPLGAPQMPVGLTPPTPV